jgi:hypothetical protein
MFALIFTQTQKRKQNAKFNSYDGNVDFQNAHLSIENKFSMLRSKLA